VIFILADDAGWGDFSVHGQRRFETPSIDRLAGEGLSFTQHYAGSTVCAPSRSALLTGQHTGHTPIRGNQEVRPEGQAPLPAAAVTLAELLRERGYATGVFGKWGLGFPGSEGEPLRQGFGAFFGYNCQRLAHTYYPEYLWEDDRRLVLEGNAEGGTGQYSHDLIQERALAFIRSHREKPFFLYLPYAIPHADMAAPEDEILARFRGRWPEEPFAGVDFGEEAFRLGPYASQPAPKAAFAAMMTRLDRSVGEILAELDAQGLDRHTLVLFSSDNGAHLEGGHDPDFFDSNGPFRGYKRDLYEGGIRVPLLARWPGVVAAGRASDHVSAFWDLLPTVAELAGAEPPEGIDGISYAPTLRGSGEQPQHDYLYWEFHEQGGKQALRRGRWKAVRLGAVADPGAPLELYDLERDPGETEDVAARHPAVVRELAGLMSEAHAPSATFPALDAAGP
jgi:arylsulfatase A-like enzyme